LPSASFVRALHHSSLSTAGCSERAALAVRCLTNFHDKLSILHASVCDEEHFTEASLSQLAHTCVVMHAHGEQHRRRRDEGEGQTAAAAGRKTQRDCSGRGSGRSRQVLTKTKTTDIFTSPIVRNIPACAAVACLLRLAWAICRRQQASLQTALRNHCAPESPTDTRVRRAGHDQAYRTRCPVLTCVVATNIVPRRGCLRFLSKPFIRGQQQTHLAWAWFFGFALLAALDAGRMESTMRDIVESM
jgi:hypothetical protein